jgi:hypothetical protein
VGPNPEGYGSGTQKSSQRPKGRWGGVGGTEERRVRMSGVEHKEQSVQLECGKRSLK